MLKLSACKAIDCGGMLQCPASHSRKPGFWATPFELFLSNEGWGILMATAGLMTWFKALIVVRFIPHRIGPVFFRIVNAILGVILLGFAKFCAIVLSREFPH
jgi:uncharacterized membrane-anchored protein